MKKIIYFIFIVVFFSINANTYAQNGTNYPIKTVNGKEYYEYKIQAGEGLYAISKKFNVSQSEINNANPQIQDGLKAGDTIFIPKKGKINVEQKNSEATKTEYIIHKVKKKQSLFAISRLYNVSQEEIIALNPGSDKGIKEGDELRIPQKKKDNDDAKKTKKETTNKKEKEVKKENNKTPDEKEVEKPKTKSTSENTSSSSLPNLHIGRNTTYITHLVQPKETLYSIGKRYDISVEEIIANNPEAEKSLQAGSELKIPINSSNIGTISNNTSTKNTTTKNSDNKKPQNKSSYKIAYLLPFMLNENGEDATANKFLEFFMGSLLSIKNVQNNGINYEIYSFDTEKSETKIYSILNQPILQEMDLIIGPAYSSQIPILADFAKRREIYTVIPFSSKVDDIEDNPYIFQFNPDKDLQEYFTINVFKNNFQDANIILANIDASQNSDEKEYFESIGEKLNKANILYTKINKADLQKNNIEKYLSTTKKNILLFDTYKYQVAQSYLINLYDIKSKYDLGVIGQYAWKSEAGKKPKMYYIAPFMDDERRRTNASAYESQYSLFYGKLRGEKNPRYDMIGYDITNYFLSLLKNNEVEIDESTRNLKGAGIQTDLHFKRIGNKGGFMNHQLFLIEDDAKKN